MRNLNKKVRLQLFLLIMAFCSMVSFMYIGNRNVTITSEVIIAAFLLNGCIWGILLFQSVKKYPFSLETMFWAFSFFFFFLAGMVQYQNKWYAWTVKLEERSILEANICLFFWTVSVCLGKAAARQLKISKIKIRCKTMIHSNMNKKERYELFLPLFTAVNAADAVIKLHYVGFFNLMSRGTNASLRFSDAGTMRMMFMAVVTAVCYYAAAVSIFVYKKHKSPKGIFYMAVNVLFLVIGYFPTGIPRYLTAVLYLGLILVYFDRMHYDRSFLVLFLFSFMILLPLLNSFRYVSFTETSVVSQVLSLLKNFSISLRDHDYDAYTLFVMSLDYIHKMGPGANHLLSIAFFWIPRSIWQTKALPGASVLTIDRGLGSLNVSCPFPAEGILDGGYLGMFLFGLFLGVLVYVTDAAYWNAFAKRRDRYNADVLLYPVLVIFFFFMYRGDMQWTFPYLFGFLFVWFVFFRLIPGIKVVRS